MNSAQAGTMAGNPDHTAAGKRDTPVVFLAGSSAARFEKAYEMGAQVCLPRQMALDHPPLLATVMEQALKTSAMRQSHERARERLVESRQHVDRLVRQIPHRAAQDASVGMMR